MSGDIPQIQAANNAKISGHPLESEGKFLIPSPVPTRRNRTYSQSERLKEGPSFKGKVKSFCRHKGHGFIEGEDEETLFVHISDIDGEYVPKEGDDVKYKLFKLPQNPNKHQAVHVIITHLSPGSHETWNEPSPTHSPRH